ncbi:hypothetical protein NKI56_29410 [Mesorhizobium sp. M0622]|uniref:hypothetical protein n=1 Tax=unclassified Mesorhizobium TaxID=325217 RepID=UPI00333749EA
MPLAAGLASGLRYRMSLRCRGWLKRRPQSCAQLINGRLRSPQPDAWAIAIGKLHAFGFKSGTNFCLGFGGYHQTVFAVAFAALDRWNRYTSPASKLCLGDTNQRARCPHLSCCYQAY